MLRSLDTLEKGFQGIVTDSKEKCEGVLEEIRHLILNVMTPFTKVYVKCCTSDERQQLPQYLNSLAEKRFLELVRVSGQILFLSCNGLYRSAFDNIRYVLESIVQALYIDHRHPGISIATKLDILKEVEDKREYHALHLIGDLEIDHKDWLRSEYKKLSQIIHPSHKQIIITISDIMEEKGVPASVDCEEISKIYNSMIRMYDIFFFLFVNFFQEIKEPLKMNTDFIKSIKEYNLILLSRSLKIKLRHTRA